MWLQVSASRLCQGREDEAVELRSRSQGGTMLSLLRAVAEPQPAAMSVMQVAQLMAILSQLSSGFAGST